MRAPEHDTWDQKLGRIIRAVFSPLTGRMEGADEWERERIEALDRELAAEHDELRDRRARKEDRRG